MGRIAETIVKARGKLNRRRRAYQQVFGSPMGQEVLQDLIFFCRGTETTFHEDPRVHAVLEGRREVLIRIAQHMNLSFEKLWAIYDGRTTTDE